MFTILYRDFNIVVLQANEVITILDSYLDEIYKCNVDLFSFDPVELSNILKENANQKELFKSDFWKQTQQYIKENEVI